MKLRKLLQKKLGIALLPAALTLAVCQPGCAVFGSPGPSAVSQGQAYQSGDVTFDEFFAKLHELSVEMAKAPAEEKDHRIALAKKLGMDLEEKAPPAPAPAASPAAEQPTNTAQPSYTDALQQQAVSAVPGLGQLNQLKNQVDSTKQQISQLGTLTSAATTPASSPATNSPAAPAKPEIVAPSASLLARTAKKHAEKLGLELALSVDKEALEEHEVETKIESLPAELDGDARKLADAIHDTTRSELRLHVRMVKAKRDLDKMASLAVALDGIVDTSFRKQGAGKKAEVRKNLEDARALIKLMQARADDVSGKANELVAKLQEVASAKFEEAPPPAPPEEPTDAVAKKEPAAKDATPAASPKQTKSSPGAAPSKPRSSAVQPKPVADFEP